ncbi:MAG TPA: alpha/beta hydrolase [Kofleriaceae bacterium]|nr:alpha/beta hydrolase [Kofleriaceae bacterium]
MKAARLFAVLALSGSTLACARTPTPRDPPPALSPGEHRFTSHGVELVFHVAGTGPVLVAHPGGPGAEWTILRMPEVEKSFTVVYMEPVGSGASGQLAGAADYTMARYVEDVEALRAHLGLARFTLLGHSHGGFVAQAYAIAHGDRLSRLILYDTSPTTGPDWQRDIERNLTWFEREPWFADAKAALAAEVTATTDEQMTAIFHREAPLYFADYSGRKAELDPLIRAMRLSVAPTKGAADPDAPAGVGVAPVFDVRAQLPSIRVPTLIVVGRKDFVCSLEMARILDARIPDSSLVVLERSGHMGHMEEPAAFARALVEFAGR